MRTDTRKKWQRAATLPKLEIIRQNLDKSDAEIGRMLGVSRSAVHALRKWHKIAKVHSATQRRQRHLEQIRGLTPGLPAEAVAARLGLSEASARMLAKKVGYQLIGKGGARHFHWRKRIQSLPPLLTISAVARELGVSWGWAALLCYRHKYKVTARNGRQRQRVPIRHWLKRPRHEHWLALLKPPKT
jgi:hypothetical protein